MCDNDSLEDNERALGSAISRRRFGIMATTTAVAMSLPAPSHAAEVIETDVSVSTPDGEADCYFVHPASGRHAAVLVWPDIFGLRPAFRLMGKRLAQSGYAVLVVNPYYRQLSAPVDLPNKDNVRDPKNWELLMPLARSLTPATTQTDAAAFIAFLDQQPSVDTSRRVGTTGYCMGGPLVMHTAASVPARVGAAASFHGGRLVTDAEDSPHRRIADMRAAFLIAIAENDHEKEPHTKGVLEKAFADADLAAEIEVYEGALHGWCPPDSQVYNEAAAERAWSRLLALFETHLA